MHETDGEDLCPCRGGRACICAIPFFSVRTFFFLFSSCSHTRVLDTRPGPVSDLRPCRTCSKYFVVDSTTVLYEK